MFFINKIKNALNAFYGYEKFETTRMRAERFADDYDIAQHQAELDAEDLLRFEEMQQQNENQFSSEEEVEYWKQYDASLSVAR